MKTSAVRTTFLTIAAVVAASMVLSGGGAKAQSSGVTAELRSAAAILPKGLVGAVAPTAPAGGVVAGIQPWVCDASKGFEAIIQVEQNVLDPILAVQASGGIKLPISPTTLPATCGQAAMQSDGVVYITQAVVDTAATPSISRGVLRTALDPTTGRLVGPSSYIATTAGLDGDQPTAAALGPDGNLYVGFLKSGNVKRIVNPGVGTTQVVQSVGSTPQGHPSRAFAFVGNDLYIASIDAFSVIHNATAGTCTGGCNATVISDGFSGIAHTGATSDGTDAVYFSVSGNVQIPGSSQVWRYSTVTGLFTFVAEGGADRNGANASNFSFVGGKTNLLTLDAGGNLWIGDDTSNGTAVGAGRIWTVSAASLATLTGGSSIAGTNIQAIFNVLHGPWIVNFFSPPSNATTTFVPTFNADGTFTATITTSAGVSTDSGTWQLTPPETVQPFANPQAHLTITDSQGVVLFSNDILLLTVDTFTSVTTGTGSLGNSFELLWHKFAP
jgi:hypothetical protein